MPIANLGGQLVLRDISVTSAIQKVTRTMRSPTESGEEIDQDGRNTDHRG